MSILTRVVRFINDLIDIIYVIVIILMLIFSFWGVADTFEVIGDSTLDKEIMDLKPTETSSSDYEDAIPSDVVLNESLIVLSQMYPDVVSWLEIFDTNIDYPVVQGEDNEEYVFKSIDGRETKAGSIFLDSRNNRLYTDTYSLLYGHHIIGDLMFTDIVLFGDEEYFNNHQYGKLWLTDATFDIEIFSVVRCDCLDEVYFNPTLYTKVTTLDLMNQLKDDSIHWRDVEVNADDKIVGFSTCIDAYTNERVILFGLLKKTVFEEKTE